MYSCTYVCIFSELFFLFFFFLLFFIGSVSHYFILSKLSSAIKVAQAFPEKAKGAAEAAGLEGMDLMYAIKNTGTNLEQVTTVPGTAVGVKDTVVDLFTLIKGLVAGDFK